MVHRTYAVDHDRAYGRDIRIAFAVSLAILVASFLFLKQPVVKPYVMRAQLPSIEIDPYPLVVKPPSEHTPVVRPSLPIPSADGKATDPGVGIHNFGVLDSIVVAPTIEVQPWWKVEKKPKTIHQAVPVYPEMARTAGIEGNVVVTAVVDTLGNVSSAEILASSGSTLLDQAALEAARNCIFSPGMQQDRPVPVYVSIPFSFKLQ
jgi:protein TonB